MTKWVSTAATAALVVSAIGGGVSQAAEISGAGATAPAPVYQKWAEQYGKSAGAPRLNYQAIGSGGGIKQIYAKTVQFGASDKPVAAADLQSHGLVQFPTVIVGIVPVVNLPGVTPGQLHLAGPVLADIYSGKITRWNDPKIAAANKGLKIPALPITVVHRSDGSGTTYLFTSYLAEVSADWKGKAGDAVNWPTGQGGKGNDGVSAFVRQTSGSIGYVEYAFAKLNKLTFATMINKDGKVVAPEAKAFAAAAAKASFTPATNFAPSLLNQAGAGAWPISGATFILLYKQGDAGSGEVLKFFDWAYKNGDAAANELAYVPLPAGVKAAVRKSAWSQVTVGGKPAFTGK